MSLELSESFEERYKGSASSNGEKIIEELSKEVGLDLGEYTIRNRSRLSVKGIYFLYKAVCEMKGKDPELVYNGNNVKSKEALSELESEAGESFEEFFGEVTQ